MGGRWIDRYENWIDIKSTTRSTGKVISVLPARPPAFSLMCRGVSRLSVPPSMCFIGS